MNTVQNGKGSKPRTTDWKKYWESDLWDNLKKKIEESKDTEQTSSECSEPVEE